MRVCICGDSAYEFMQSSGRLAPNLLERRRTQKLDGCGLPPEVMLEDDLLRLGVKKRPVHIMVDGRSGGRRRGDIKCHRCHVELPARSLIHVRDDVLVTSPALTFLQLAAYGLNNGASHETEDIALAGFELCGTYLLDSSWDGLTNTEAPLTSVSQIKRLLDAMPNASGRARALDALALVRDRSNSPMETVLCALLTWPRRLGGYALGPVLLNYPVATAVGDRFVDIAFVEQRVGLEYKGRKYHSIERVGRDDRRQNKLVGVGWTILNVWYEDLIDSHLFDQLVVDLMQAMGKRLRIRSDAFMMRRELLRLRLMPSIERFGESSVSI